MFGNRRIFIISVKIDVADTRALPIRDVHFEESRYFAVYISADA
jgi:hypothetical protein